MQDYISRINLQASTIEEISVAHPNFATSCQKVPIKNLSNDQRTKSIYFYEFLLSGSAWTQYNIEDAQYLSEAGNLHAQTLLGLALISGAAGSKNPGRGAQLILDAAEAGCSDAQAYAAYIYFDGHGLPSDPSKSYLWALISRDAGHPAGTWLVYKLRVGLPESVQKAVEREYTTLQ